MHVMMLAFQIQGGSSAGVPILVNVARGAEEGPVHHAEIVYCTDA